MVRRSKDWNEGLAKDLKNPIFARDFLIASIEEGIPLQIALGKIIRTYGIKEFSGKIGIAGSNLVRAIHPRSNPTQETLNRLLKPFGLKLSVTPIPEKERRRTA